MVQPDLYITSIKLVITKNTKASHVLVKSWFNPVQGHSELESQHALD